MSRPTSEAAIARLWIREQDGIPRRSFPITGGVALPRGRLGDVERLTLRGPDGCPAPLQAEVMTRWPDGSVRWLLLDFQADAEAMGETAYELADGPPVPVPSLEWEGVADGEPLLPRHRPRRHAASRGDAEEPRLHWRRSERGWIGARARGDVAVVSQGPSRHGPEARCRPCRPQAGGRMRCRRPCLRVVLAGEKLPDGSLGSPQLVPNLRTRSA